MPSEVVWKSKNTVYSGYSGHVYSGHSDIVATFPGTQYISTIIFRSDVVANWIQWPDRGGQRWPPYPKCTVLLKKMKIRSIYDRNFCIRISYPS